MRPSDHSSLVSAFTDFNESKRQQLIAQDDYFQAVVSNHAYADMTPRTIRGISKEVVSGALNNLSTALLKYFNGEAATSHEVFDSWHNNTCNSFINDCRDANISIKYGKAQKIVNMSFKYLYCLCDETENKGHFDFCHMPLDTYILNWFCDNVVVSLDAEKRAQVKIDKIKKTSWSNLEYGSSEETYTYMWIQSRIRDYLGTQNHQYKAAEDKPLTPFLAEFYIWPEQKYLEACKSFCNQPFLNENYPGYSDNGINKECRIIIDALNMASERMNTMQ